jgi:succinoglycan biosynthesis transport protein ExoP
MHTPVRSRRAGLAAAQPPLEDKHLADYFRVLYKRRWIALPVFLIVVVVGALNTFRQTPIYQARIQMLIEKDTPSVARLDQMFQSQEGWYNDDFYQTQYRILQSRSLAKRTIDLMKLWDVKRLGNGPEPKAALTVTGLFWTSVNAAVGLARKPFASESPAPSAAPPPPPDETAAQSGRIDEFLGGLGVTPVRNSRIVEIQYTSSDPVFAADAANSVAKAYIQQNLEVKFSASKDAADWLSERLSEQRRAVQASEAALQAYKEKNGTVSITDGASNIVVQRLTDLNGALTKAKTDRINKEALYNQLRAAEGSGALDTYPAVLGNEYIQKLKTDLADAQRQQATLAQRYADQHPEMIKARSAVQSADAKLRGELGKVVESVKNEYQAALSQETSLQSALDSQKGEALSLNRRGIEYGVLQREVESNRQIYESLMQRTKETGISSELRTTNVRVVDKAEVPRAPILPRHDRDVLLSTFGGLVLAIGLAFGFEYMDNRIKSPQELRINLGLPYLGMVPIFNGKNGILISDDVPASFSEAIKSVRTNVLFSSADEGGKLIAVTSAGPGEGKSVIAANLAVALAQTGLRVLLIDADMRRPRVHENLGLPQEPGLSNLLVGDCKPSESVRRSTASPNLWVLPSGMIPPNPAELLGSKRFEEYLATLLEQFEWVVIDSPPVLAVADASVVANIASGVVFVVGAEQTTRQAARAAIDQLHAVKAHIIGGVLNRATLDRNPYYYSHYYRKEYVQYYTQPTPRQAKSS